mgnify:CR=1 FL=1
MQLRWKSRLRMVYGHLRDKESSPYRAELCLFWGDLWKKASITSSFILVWTAYSSWLLINYSVTTDLLLIYYKSEEDDYLSTTDLLLNYYWITSEQFSEPFVHPTPLSSCLMFLPTPHGHAINCVPVHRFRVGRTPETGLTPAEWREFPHYALARILMHAVKTEPARFWRVFGWFVACFTGFPSETPWEPLRRCTQRMLW